MVLERDDPSRHHEEHMLFNQRQHVEVAIEPPRLSPEAFSMQTGYRFADAERSVLNEIGAEIYWPSKTVQVPDLPNLPESVFAAFPAEIERDILVSVFVDIFGYMNKLAIRDKFGENHESITRISMSQSDGRRAYRKHLQEIDQEKYHAFIQLKEMNQFSLNNIEVVSGNLDYLGQYFRKTDPTHPLGDYLAHEGQRLTDEVIYQRYKDLDYPGKIVIVREHVNTIAEVSRKVFGEHIPGTDLPLPYVTKYMI